MSIYLGAASVACFTVAIILIARVVLADGEETKRRGGNAKRGGFVRRLPAPRDGDRLDLASLNFEQLTEAADDLNAPKDAAVKRLLDVFFACSILIALAPLLAVTALAVKLDSRGPVLYRQRRVGRGGAVFEVYKFRSMHTDAERDGPRYATIGDARITRVGHFIRRLRIDEIPQTINVLRGEMSFVGPRPERPEFVETLSAEIPHYDARHLIKPGITGWAQVKYEYAASVEGAREKLRYDLYYITRYSPLLDVAIVVLTVRVALFGLGSR